MAEFKYVDAVKLGVNAANARVPRLQPSAIREFGDMLSREVVRGEWVMAGDDVINGQGTTVEGYLDELISTRPHWEIPAEVTEIQDDTWTSGDLTKQGARWKEIRKVFQSGKAGDILTDKAMAEEAALYGTVPGSKKKGVAPGSKAEIDDTSAPAPSTNPWNKEAFLQRNTEEQRQARIQSIIRSSTKMAAGLSKAAGVSLTGAPLRK